MELIDEILRASNLTQASKEVVRNKGAGGVDGMSVKDLEEYLSKNRETLINQIRNQSYITPNPYEEKKFPRGMENSAHWVSLQWWTGCYSRLCFELLCSNMSIKFSSYSYGFRPKRNTHQAAAKSLEYINSGYQNIVEIDLKGFFDELDHVVLLQLLYRKIKCKATMTLIRRWLRTPIEQKGKLVKRRKGVPQGS